MDISREQVEVVERINKHGLVLVVNAQISCPVAPPRLTQLVVAVVVRLGGKVDMEQRRIPLEPRVPALAQVAEAVVDGR
jgi:hypothetical protein